MANQDNWGNSTSANNDDKKHEHDKEKHQHKCTPKHQHFHIKCHGLKPNTVHDFYYEGVLANEYCIPKDPKPKNTNVTLGTPLVTDSKGKIHFHFHFTIEVEQRVDAINKVKYELAGDKKFELRAADSSAGQIVPFIRNEDPHHPHDHHDHKNK